MGHNGDPTLGEVTRRVSRVEAEVKEVREHYVMEEIFSATLLNLGLQIQSLQEDVKDIQQKMARNFMLIVTSILSPLLVGGVLFALTRMFP